MTTTTQSAASTSGRGNVFTRNVWVLLMALLMVAAVIGSSLVMANNTRELTAQEERVADLEQRLSAAQARNDEADEANLYETLGITQSRPASDRRVIEDVLSTAFTWSDAESYEAARAALINIYQVPEDSAFFSDFMPPAAFTTDAAGERQYYIDQVGLSFSLGADLDIDVVRVVGTDYEYLVLAEVDVTSSQVTPGSDGSKPTSTRQMLLRITVDGEGQVASISGIPPSGSTRVSG